MPKHCAIMQTDQTAGICLGGVALAEPVILAPMSGVTDLPFRRLVKRHGAPLVVSEMIASEAMIRQTRQSPRSSLLGTPRPASRDRVRKPIPIRSSPN